MGAAIDTLLQNDYNDYEGRLPLDNLYVADEVQLNPRYPSELPLQNVAQVLRTLATDGFGRAEDVGGQLEWDEAVQRLDDVLQPRLFDAVVDGLVLGLVFWRGHCWGSGNGWNEHKSFF